MNGNYSCMQLKLATLASYVATTVPRLEARYSADQLSQIMSQKLCQIVVLRERTPEVEEAPTHEVRHLNVAEDNGVADHDAQVCANAGVFLW